MANAIDLREEAFENKFKYDEQFRFIVNARAVKAFGLWAATQLGLEGPDAARYAEEVFTADYLESGMQDFIRKVRKDLAGKGIDFTEHQLELRFNACLEEVKKASL